MLRTRSPRAHFLYCYRKLRVRLACVKHAASVRSEPGSNSRLKPDVTTVTTRSCHDRNELLNRSVLSHSPKGAGLLNRPSPRYTRNEEQKPNGFWHVSSDCQRAGTPRPAGRTTDRSRAYGTASLMSSVNVLSIENQVCTGGKIRNAKINLTPAVCTQKWKVWDWTSLRMCSTARRSFDWWLAIIKIVARLGIQFSAGMDY